MRTCCFAKLLAMVVGVLCFVAASRAASADHTELSSAADVRELLCLAQGGFDVTSQGSLLTGEDVRTVVVCQIPEPSQEDGVAQQEQVACGAQAAMCAVLRPPIGTRVVDRADPVFETSCLADVDIGLLPDGVAESRGKAAFDCKVHSYGNSVLGCIVQWTGPASAHADEKYRLSVNFDCRVANYGTFSSEIGYAYQDEVSSDIRFSWRGNGSLTVIPR